MTVVLAGVGADSTNVGALAPLRRRPLRVRSDPEKTPDTAESETLGSWDLRAGDGTAADLTTRITPQPVHDGTRIRHWRRARGLAAPPRSELRGADLR